MSGLLGEARSMTFPYIYRWDRQGRKGQRCAVTVRGSMNSCLVVFEDGYAMCTSRNAIRKVRIGGGDQHRNGHAA
jgi:hypothetical protein